MPERFLHYEWLELSRKCPKSEYCSVVTGVISAPKVDCYVLVTCRRED